MIVVEWNALVVDDEVVVHADNVAAGEPTNGTVTSIDPHRDCNDVAIAVIDLDNPAGRTVRPTRFQVHLDSAVARAVCPWCSASPSKLAKKAKLEQWVT